MTLARDVVVPGALSQYREFSALVAGLSDAEWSAPSRCQGWSVGDVAGHVTGQLGDVVALRLEGLGSPEVTGRQVAERRGRSPRELADELDAAVAVAAQLLAAFDDEAWAAPPLPGAPGASLGFGVESLWFDTYLHGDDVRAALGRSGTSTEGLAPSLSHIAQVLTDQGWAPADLAFEGLGPFPVSGGGGRTITGDPFSFILVASGRADPALFDLDDTVNMYR